jgi:hypothetical protein
MEGDDKENVIQYYSNAVVPTWSGQQIAKTSPGDFQYVLKASRKIPGLRTPGLEDESALMECKNPGGISPSQLQSMEAVPTILRKWLRGE